MSARFTPSSVSGGGTAAQLIPGDDAITSARPAFLEGRACCCTAKPAVRVVMPPTAARPRPTDLLLCGHHYRASCHALEAAQAIVSTLPGIPPDVAGWVDVAGVAEFAGR